MSGASLALLITASLACASPTVTLPPDTPATLRTSCGWAPDQHELSFAGNATMEALWISDQNGSFRNDQVVFAIVTRDRISQHPNIGGPIVGRAICWTDGDVIGMSVLPDDWQLGAARPDF